MDKPRSVLIVDDEPQICDLLSQELTEHGYSCTTAVNGDAALTNLVSQEIDVVLLDIRLPGVSGMEVLRIIRRQSPRTKVIMVTAVKDIDVAVEAMQLGASDYIVKPFQLDRVEASVRGDWAERRQLVDRRDFENEKTGQSDMDQPFAEMNAIARGVEARLNLVAGHSTIVTKRTEEIAHRLGIPQQEIQEWVAVRARSESMQTKEVNSVVGAVTPSPFANSIANVTRLLLCEPDLGQNQQTRERKTWPYL